MPDVQVILVTLPLRFCCQRTLEHKMRMVIGMLANAEKSPFNDPNHITWPACDQKRMDDDRR